jgi:hypothetical protein
MQSEQSMKVIRPRVEAARRGGLLIIGFKAWSATVPIGRPSLRERLDGGRTRAVWDDPQHRGARVAVTVAEHTSAAEALDALALELESNQLANLPEGPSGLGEVSFVHPEGAPPAVFLARANLTLWVTSFGNRPAEVLSIAREIDADLKSRPSDAREGLEVTTSGNVIRARPRFAGEDAYLKFFAPGAELRKSDGGIAVTGEGAEVGVFSLEPGRETLSGIARLRP